MVSTRYWPILFLVDYKLTLLKTSWSDKDNVQLQILIKLRDGPIYDMVNK